MASDVIMPQMGESIAEGTVTKWLKQVGDEVERDEPLFEISTDKVDAEIPSPEDGVLLEILVPEGETVEINTVVARLGAEGEVSGGGAPAVSSPDAEGATTGGLSTSTADRPPASTSGGPSVSTADAAFSGGGSVDSVPAPDAAAAPVPAPASAEDTPASGPSGRRDRIATKSSPVVRKIAAEHGIDLTQVPGTGVHGRVTKKDILAFLEGGGVAALGGARSGAQPGSSQAGAAARMPAPAPGGAAQDATAATPAAVSSEGAYQAVSVTMLGVSAWPAKTVQGYLSAVGEGDRVEKLSTMRKKIAEHMVISKALSAHVHTIYEVDMSRVDALRKSRKEAFLEASGGAKLTYTVFMVKAVVDALKAYPVINASLNGDEAIYHRDINVGLAVALDDGLIVPVLHRAQDLSMTGIARAIADLAARARDRKLELPEIQGATFSITNPGSFGGLIGFPVINQPNVAILGMGMVEKRVCVVNDAIAIRPKMYIALGYDHRLVDGAAGELFLGHIKNTMENFDETAL